MARKTSTDEGDTTVEEDGDDRVNVLQTLEEDTHAGSDHPLNQTTSTTDGSVTDISFQGLNSGMESNPPPLPERGYDLPPRDYPMSPDHTKPLEQTGDLISDDDYYAQMMNSNPS